MGIETWNRIDREAHAARVLQLVQAHQIKQTAMDVLIDGDYWVQYETVCMTCGILKSKSQVTHLAAIFKEEGLYE